MVFADYAMRYTRIMFYKDQKHDHMQDKLRDLSCGISLQLSRLLKNIRLFEPARKASREAYLVIAKYVSRTTLHA